MKLQVSVAPADRILVAASLIALSGAIFWIDMHTNSAIAIAPLYVIVILISARFCRPTGIALVTASCLVLVAASFVLNTQGGTQLGLINSALGGLVLCITSYLIIKIEGAKNTAAILAESNRFRDALIGSISHNLRTPLATILGGASILAEAPDVAQNARLRDLTEGIRHETERLNSEIQNLLDSARIASDGLQSRRDWTDPIDVINAAVVRARHEVIDHRVEISCDNDLPPVYIDPRLIEQALGQIIANAAKFSPPSSTIRIAAGVKDRQLEILVADEGVGLTKDEKARLTERFFRGARHIEKIPGSGLGLWIATTFVASSGGTLVALSEGEGRGTIIKIAFPTAHESQVGSNSVAGGNMKFARS
jgi:signal transduction histidine kinase